LAGANLSGVSHDKQRYSVDYDLTFGPSTAPSASSPNGPSAPGDRDEGSPEGAAQVAWEVALVRDAPKSGKVVARLQRGTTVHVGAIKDGWYPVRYGEGFAADGWVYRGALGK
jgi:hypothetical protein